MLNVTVTHSEGLAPGIYTGYVTLRSVIYEPNTDLENTDPSTWKARATQEDEIVVNFEAVVGPPSANLSIAEYVSNPSYMMTDSVGYGVVVNYAAIAYDSSNNYESTTGYYSTANSYGAQSTGPSTGRRQLLQYPDDYQDDYPGRDINPREKPFKPSDNDIMKGPDQGPQKTGYQDDYNRKKSPGKRRPFKYNDHELFDKRD